jgi:hypothetical protein
VAKHARSMLGFKGRTTPMDLLNVNPPSQFLFYRGMIQAKGSVDSVKAYINSRRFIDAKIDEFWAWKIAEFGDSRRRVYPEVNVFTTDTLIDDIRLEFLAQSELETDVDVVDSVIKGFKVVSYTTPERWNNFPEQKSEIGSPLFLDAEVSTVKVIYSGRTAPASYGHVDYWYDTVEGKIKVFDGAGWIEDTSGVTSFQTITTSSVDVPSLYFTHGDKCDDVRVIRKIIDAPITDDLSTPYVDDFTTVDYTTSVMEQGTGSSMYVKVNSEVLRFNLADIDTGLASRPTIISVYTLNPAKSKISPAKLVDKKTGAVVQQVPVWHPARGHHSHIAIHNVDLQSATDPARYNTTVNPNTAADNNWDQNYWNQTEVGTIWLDTSRLGYVPYYDDKVLPNVNDRLYKWGNQAPWSATKVYEWVKSTTPPAEWTDSGVPRSSVFYRERLPAAVVDSFTTTEVIITATDPLYVDGDRVIFLTDGGTLPEEIGTSTQYTLHATSPSHFTLTDTLSGTVITMANPSAAIDVKVIKAFTVEGWTEHTQDRVHLTTPEMMFNNSVAHPVYPQAVTTIKWTLPVGTTAWNTDIDTVDVYVNGVLKYAGLAIAYASSKYSVDITSQPLIVNEYDLIDIIRPVHSLTSEELAFDPDTEDDGTQLINWTTDYQYSSNTQLVNAGDVNSTTSDTYYYFWVEQSPTRLDGTQKMSTQAISTQLRTIPTPYLIVQRPKDSPIMIERYGYDVPPYESSFDNSGASEDLYLVPVLYREAIVRGVSSYITEDDRYAVRFTCDHSLRNTLTSSTAMLKNKHQEWMLFRKSQMSTVPRELWDRLTEALVGYKLTDNTIRVPTLEREMYDATYETDTQYGLGVDQSFVDKTLGIATVIAYLQDPNNDFSPTDIDSFFAKYSFDTPADIELVMDVIYETFNSEHVNAIWFDVLNDSLSLRAKYKELMKTSWVALHGIRVLEVGGLFDD